GDGARDRPLGGPRGAGSLAGRPLRRQHLPQPVQRRDRGHGRLGGLRVDDHDDLCVRRPQPRLSPPAGAAAMKHALSMMVVAVLAAGLRAQEEASTLYLLAGQARLVVVADVLARTDPDPDTHETLFRTV